MGPRGRLFERWPLGLAINKDDAFGHVASVSDHAGAERIYRRRWSLTAATDCRRVSRYDIWYVEIFSSARRHGIADDDIRHAVENALAVGEQDDGKVLYLGADRAGNLLEVVSVVRDDGSEVVIHAMRMRTKYEPFLLGEGGSDA